MKCYNKEQLGIVYQISGIGAKVTVGPVSNVKHKPHKYILDDAV